MAPGNHKQNYQKRPVLKLGCWNVWTMTTGLSASLQDIKDSRKTAVINDERKRLNVDIATLQETWLANSGTLKEKDYIFFWQGMCSNEPREHGVGFVVKNNLLRMVELGSGGSKRLLTLRLNSTTGPVTLISVYAPSLSATPDTLVWSGQNEWKLTATTGAVHLPWPVHYKLLLPHQASTQGFVETPTLKALASTESNLGQTCCFQECSPHTLLPQCGLWYSPLLGVL